MKTVLTSGVCNVVRACNDCGKVYHIYTKHVCCMVYCDICRDHQPQDHMCFIQPLNLADDSGGEGGEQELRKKKKVQRHIFYNFECMLVDHQHVPNLCILHKVCTECIEKTMAEACFCNREQIVFRGEDTLRQVGEWLFSGHNRGAICIAHNSQGYDVSLLLDYIHDSGIMLVLIENGKKIMSIEVKGTQFIDSLNYFTTALANLPMIFGLEELHKGYFPHLFLTPENQQYKGEVPAMSYYDPEGMKLLCPFVQLVLQCYIEITEMF